MQYTARKVWFSLFGMAALALALLWHEGAFSRSEAVADSNKWGASHFPNVELVTHDGRKVRLYDDLLKGKTVAVNTFFADCGDVCPLSTAKMLELKKLLGDRVGKDVFFYSISVDPDNDTPEALKAYAERFHTGPGWVFLTGKGEDVRLAIRKLGLGTVQATSPRDSHSTTLMVGHEPTGQWMKNSTTDNPRFVAAMMRGFLGWGANPEARHYAEARAMPEVTNGQFLFNNSCASCHTIGQGDKVGPDLAGVTERRPRAWLERFILLPDEVIASGDPLANELLAAYKGVRMPNLGLSRSEVAQLLQHVEMRTAEVRKTQAAEAPAAAHDHSSHDHAAHGHAAHDHHDHQVHAAPEAVGKR